MSRNLLSGARRTAAAIGLGLAALGAPAAAHEFNLALVVPPGSDAQTRRDDMRTAFLIASRERDGHAAETSEGHLGGMDVQLELIGEDKLDDLAALRPDFVLAPLWSRDAPALAGLETALDAVLLTQAEIEARPAPDMLEADAAQGYDRFDARFMAATGRAPDAAAVATYLAARWVDRAVRPLAAVTDRAALRRALGG